MGLTVFAIANATELAFGKDPLLCLYDTEVMQIHLLQCLESRKLERNPATCTLPLTTKPAKIPLRQLYSGFSDLCNAGQKA